MKKEIIIPVLKEEDLVAAKQRRENYASMRDQQAAEFNDAIVKRLLLESKHPVKCESCGKEFTSEKDAVKTVKCPACS